ncbi:NADH-quinone oxidoreductase subunit J [bacterium (Candidatus Blackallbacteria) CG17_big_fil_post_rev_8_21_14_2_50_48_46]|uniref:NADH-quinone oxidoreductase subunit J n=1 Tax=bacterium (Candidatus Blackallbacteria) CG17_big_fil_post_rev_8_21_14_2_50_48_46 TaxID=2014261 RepID=A0A2M7FXQ5_9BACT|nr:MAG: NADH-quinone oxidoreductase subunit J [bacterium (Candidatus Blackallbacteria) CG18_big_fil_WC_8_21_14_2_50_49_26]PIW14091.1 MAG: NADH-quinone oxidoreductase subunit J [bacterium (Candidatus Blackallbacteria) CG17_big_fil_post_rev_8_21_14_2_50_48_46]PIW45821.1 MAG: NADH-quinone oxidoreductase subunit J [bacterium (Candidatus Blackallbacteria) CG13_big_fil_rev_8_21_14_2_50_49_14]
METTAYFTILSIIAVTGGLMTITRRHPLSATLSLVMTLIALAGLYALLSADFLFVIQILVYAGAIMALMVFVIMLLNVRIDHLPPEKNIASRVFLALLALAPFFFLVQRAMIAQFGNAVFPTVSSDFGSIQAVGLALYRNHVFPFEVISILLLVALVGVVALAKRRA